MDMPTMLRYEEQIRREQTSLIKSRGIKIPPPDPNAMPDPIIVDHGLIFHTLHDHVCGRKPNVVPPREPGSKVFAEKPFEIWRRMGRKARGGEPTSEERDESALTTCTPS